MSYVQFETRFFLAVVQASNAGPQQGYAEAMEAARSVSPDTPEHIVGSAVKSLAERGWLTIASEYLDGRKIVRMTGEGYSAAEQIRTQIAEDAAPPRKIGF
jgi:hypothetical protein